jgi:hypothetical protein
VAVETGLNVAMLLRHLQRRDVLALPGGPGCIRMLAPLILDRREADVVVETLAAVILASRPPRRRTVAGQSAGDSDVELAGRSTRHRSRATGGGT